MSQDAVSIPPLANEGISCEGAVPVSRCKEPKDGAGGKRKAVCSKNLSAPLGRSVSAAESGGVDYDLRAVLMRIKEGVEDPLR